MLVSEIGYFKSNNSVSFENFNKLQTVKSNLSEGFGHDNNATVSPAASENVITSAQRIFNSIFHKKNQDSVSKKLSVLA